SFTFIDPAGNQAQYTVYDADRHNEYHWSTDHGDRGVDGSIRASSEPGANSWRRGAGRIRSSSSWLEITRCSGRYKPGPRKRHAPRCRYTNLRMSEGLCTQATASPGGVRRPSRSPMQQRRSVLYYHNSPHRNRSGILQITVPEAH